MTTVQVSEKGQINLPARIRRELGMEPSSVLELEVQDGGILIRPLRSIRELEGSQSRYAEGKSAEWEEVRAATEDAIAREVITRGR